MAVARPNGVRLVGVNDGDSPAQRTTRAAFDADVTVQRNDDLERVVRVQRGLAPPLVASFNANRSYQSLLSGGIDAQVFVPPRPW